MTSDTYDIPHPDRGEPNNHLDTRGHPDRDLLGEVIGSVVHDLHNLLQRITNALEIELHSDAPVTRERVHANGIQAVEQARRLAQRLLEVGRDSPAMWRPLLPGVLIGRLAPLLRAMLGERIRFELVLEPPRWRAMMPSARFEAAILNLVANARDTITGHGRVRLSLKHIASGQRPAGLPDRD
ncbi:MAG: hypothetical protein R3E83_15465 [Burkholderiaceae bacterium]